MKTLQIIIDNELSKFQEVTSKDEIIIKQAKVNKFDDFKKSRRYSELITEWSIAMYEKYAVKGVKVYEGNDIQQSICKIIGECFLKFAQN